MSPEENIPEPAEPQPTPPTSEIAPQVEATTASRWLRTPPIDIFETEDGLVLRADLPGVTSESLELQVQENRLTLFGRATTELPDESRLVHQEYHVGDFLRSFIISDDVDHERISAKLNDGVLELTLPRAPRAKPRKIEVKTE